MLCAVDRIDFVEPVGQIGRVAHVVDRLPHGPVRRHRDEFGLHPPAGGIFRIIQAALERVALRRRQFFEDFFLVLLVEAFEQFDGVVGFQFANALRDRLRFEFLEDFLADGVVDLVERREIEIGAGQLDQADAVVGFERLDQVAEVGFMEFGDDGAQKCGIGRLNRARDFRDKLVTNPAIFVAHRVTVEQRRIGGLGNVGIFGHTAPRRLTGLMNLSELSLDALPNRQHLAQ